MSGWEVDGGVTISFLSIVSFGCTETDGVAEGRKIKNIWNGPLKL